MTAYHCELAVLPDGRVVPDLLIEVVSGRISAVRPAKWAFEPDPEAGVMDERPALVAVPSPGEEPAEDAPRDGRAGVQRLRGLVLPGFANAHSHVFHRALRGRTHGEQGSFWTWRERMYELAARLEPDTLLQLARATFAEMALAGYTAVGEFHYLHHRPDGSPYKNPNLLGEVVIEAAREAGLRITLLDTCYLTGGIGRPLEGVQRRFGDDDARAWAKRVTALSSNLAGEGGVRVGAAIHSVRAVPRDQLAEVVGWASLHEAPLHMHVSEQPAENEQCLEAYGATPTAVLEAAGALGPFSTAVHATHLTEGDVESLGATATHVCMCPTTERDLADGVGPARALLDHGARLTLGSDGHAVIDGLEEARAIELNLRLATGERGLLKPVDLLEALTSGGHFSLGWPAAGALRVGARADLVAVRLDSIRTAAGPRLEPDTALPLALYAASAADITDVIVDGRPVVRDGVHMLGDVTALMTDAIARLMEDR